MSSTYSNNSSERPRNHSRQSTGSFFTYPVSYAVSSVVRRLTSEPTSPKASPHNSIHESMNGLYTPPQRHASPFQPPPLTPLSLSGYRSSTRDSAKLLSRALAEEIRLLVPPRLQLMEHWSLAYSLEQDGVSLGTLYKRSEEYQGKRGGYVLVVRDGDGGVFGAYLSDPPFPTAHYYGTGECFLWRASVLPSLPTLANLPPPPSADTTHAQRMTTVQSPTSGTATPERIRFKAFPYSGMNDYMIFCEQGYLSVGGGDGHYGLWLNDNLERGVSDSCPTFGNEPLSEEGSKFDVLGVEMWYIGS